MNKIKEMIYSKFNYTRGLISDTIYIDKLNISNLVKTAMLNLYESGKNHRPMSQYGGLAQITMDMNKNIEIAVENSPHSTMRKMVYEDLVSKNNEYHVIKDNPNDKNLNIFKKFLYPTINVTKKEMFETSKKNHYDDILKETWSCWFPVNGKPCGKCPMCSDRYVAQK